MKIKLKLKILIMSNVIFSLFWILQMFSYDYFEGFAFKDDFIIFPFLMLFVLVYSSIYSYKLLNNNLEKILQERAKITLMAFLSAAPNFVGTILYIFVNDELLNLSIVNPDLIEPVQKKKALDPRLKRLDIMFKLGTFLVLMAGILFAFSSDAPGISRTLAFLAFAIIYIVISKYLEKLKIFTSAKLYWFLSMGFFLLSFVSIGYIELFGNWYSFFGEGAWIFIGGCFTIFSLLSFATYINFKEEKYLFGLYAGLLGFGISLCSYFALTVEETLISILPIFVILSFFSKNSKIFKSKVLFEFTNMTVIAMILVFFINMFNLENIVAAYLLTIFFVTYIHLMILQNKDSDLKFFGTILSYCVFVPSIIVGEVSVETFALATALFAIISYGISYLFKSLEIRMASLTSANVLLILAFILSLFGDNLISILISIMAISLSLVVNILDSNLDYEFKFELYTHPIKIAMFIYSVLGLVLTNSLKLESFIVLTFVFYVSSYSLVKSEAMNKIYRIASFVALVILFVNLSSLSSIFLILLSLSALFMYYANVYWKKNESKGFVNSLYVLMLIFVYRSTFLIDNLMHVGLYDTFIFANIISLLLFWGIAVFHKKDKNKYNLALLVAVIPMMALMDKVQNPEIFAILASLLILYVFFILSSFINKEKTKKLMREIALVLSLALVVFDEGILTFIYSMALSITVLVLSYSKEEAGTLFKIAITSLILTLIYRLKEYIFRGPLYLYILIAGLALIIFVTVKQLKADKELKEQKEEDEANK